MATYPDEKRWLEMRMWMVPPKAMCRKHLLGEHLEMHMFLGTIKSGKKLDGYIKGGLVEVHNIFKRHNQLAKEMKNRGYNHKSEMKLEDCGLLWKEGKVDIEGNLRELRRRCKDCESK